MWRWWNRRRRLAAFGREERGAAVVEFAFVLPVLVLLFGGIVELGRAYYHANGIERGLRAGALYAARRPLPLSAADRTTTSNLVRTGSMDGSASPLASGWSEAGASLTIDTTKTYTIDDQTVRVVALQASVPFDPMFPSLMAWLGLTPETIVLRHEQGWIGD